jgi:hypothetical protein
MINLIKNINTISGMGMDRKERGRIILLKSGSLPSYPIIVSALSCSSSLLVLDSDEGKS